MRERERDGALGRDFDNGEAAMCVGGESDMASRRGWRGMQASGASEDSLRASRLRARGETIEFGPPQGSDVSFDATLVRA